MRTVIWEDRNGWKHRSLVRSGDPDSSAEYGVSQDPPNLHDMDLNGILRDIHNGLVEAGVHDWATYQREQQRMTSIINTAVKRRIIGLLRQEV